MSTSHQFATGGLQRITFTSDGRAYEFDGLILAVASSRKPTHNAQPHGPDGVVARGTTCSACRWTELTIYKRVTRAPHGVFDSSVAEDYVVVRTGRSRAAGEVTLERVLETSSPYEVVEFLTVRRAPNDDRPAETFFPPQHARALAAASAFDLGIRDAYINRAVI